MRFEFHFSHSFNFIILSVIVNIFARLDWYGSKIQLHCKKKIVSKKCLGTQFGDILQYPP